MSTVTRKRRYQGELDVPAICEELRRLQRYATVNLKSRIMLENRLAATVAVYEGYYAGLDKEKRTKAIKDAMKLVADIIDGKEHQLTPLVLSSKLSIDGFDSVISTLEKEMSKQAKRLPVNSWVEKVEQRGFGVLSLARIIGETGDLANYPNPGKVWRRMGLAPYTKQEQTYAGATWRGDGAKKKQRNGLSLTKTEWEEYGYSPRRRSVMYVIADPMLRQNKSIYRQRYDEAKSLFAAKHPDTCPLCSHCDATGYGTDGGECGKCGGNGFKPGHAHNHGLLVMTKLLLKNLWIEWNPDLAGPGWTE